MHNQACNRVEPILLNQATGRANFASEIQTLRNKLDQMEADLQQAPQQAKGFQKIRQIIRDRSKRQRFFDSDLFADPAWDILLELYACELGQSRVSVSKLCLAANVPATTALRWINVLEKRGLVERIADWQDARRFWVALTPAGLEKMQRYFESL